MEELTILDDEKDPAAILALIEKQKKKYLVRALIFTAINMALYIFVLPESFTGRDAIKTALMGQGIGFPLLSFMLGLPAAFIPYKNLSYTDKYVRTSLLIFYILTAFMTFMFLLNVLFITIGYQ